MFIGDRKDQKTLERLRAERQAKIDELKERTNYYTTQQLIQVIVHDLSSRCSIESSFKFWLSVNVLKSMQKLEMQALIRFSYTPLMLFHVGILDYVK